MKGLLIAGTFLLLAAGCHPDKQDGPGKGGSATVVVYPQHHQVAKNIINGKVYVRYNTLDAPTSGVYDDSATCTNHDSLLSGSFPGLKNGNYYFYGTGYDTSVHQPVKGGTPYTITTQSSQNLALPVSEN